MCCSEGDDIATSIQPTRATNDDGIITATPLVTTPALPLPLLRPWTLFPLPLLLPLLLLLKLPLAAYAEALVEIRAATGWSNNSNADKGQGLGLGPAKAPGTEGLAFAPLLLLLLSLEGKETIKDRPAPLMLKEEIETQKK